MTSPRRFTERGILEVQAASASLSVNFADQAQPGDRVAVVVTAALTTNEVWTPCKPGQLAVFVDGAPVTHA